METKLSLAKIEELRFLEDNWDGYGGLKIFDEVMVHLDNILITVLHIGLPVPDVAPHPNGIISLEFPLINGEIYLEIGRFTYSGYVKRYSNKKYKYKPIVLLNSRDLEANRDGFYYFLNNVSDIYNEEL